MALKLKFAPLDLVLALHKEEIERHQHIDLSFSTYPSSYCIFLGLENPMSDSPWNENFALGDGWH